MKGTFLINIAAAASLLSTMNSCEQFVEIAPPKAQMTEKQVFADSATAVASIFGLYATMDESAYGLMSGAITLLMGLSADELVPSSSGGDYNQFLTNRIAVGNWTNSALWMSAYQHIYRANACIEGLRYSPSISDPLRNRLIAEAITIRAFIYFNLTNAYGDVPLVLGTDYRTNRLLPRQDIASIFNQLIDDLRFAQINLKGVSFSANRANYYAATALLAKILLNLRRYRECEVEASIIVESGRFRLTDEPDQAFIAGSTESLWELTPVDPSRQTAEGFEFVPWFEFSIPRYQIAKSVTALLEQDDKRRSQWLRSTTIGTETYSYPYKYKVAFVNSTGRRENYILLRLAEIVLVRAEARAYLFDLDNDGAISDLEMVRSRSIESNLAHITDSEGLISEILLERRRELFCEWGSRWSDLKRTGQADTVLSQLKEDWTETAILFPIPLPEINANPNLIQNPGY